MRTRYAFLLLLASTLILHGCWERIHIVLYTGYSTLEGVLPVWVFATLGDLLYTLVVVALIGALKHDARWFTRTHHTLDYSALALLGFLIALMVEYKGLYLGRWEYLSTMPIIPLLEVGLSPILQMTFLLPLSVFITRLLTKQS